MHGKITQISLHKIIFVITGIGIVLAPILVFRLPETGITASDICFLMAIFLVLGLSIAKLPRDNLYWAPWFIFAMLLVTGLLFSSIMAHSSAIRALNASLKYLFSLVIIPVVLWTIVAYQSEAPRVFVRCAIWGMMIVSFVAVVIYMFEPPLLADYVRQSGRVDSLMLNPNLLGKMIGIMTPLVYFAWSQRIISNLEVGFVLPIFTLALLSTGSVGGFLTMIVALSAFLLLSLDLTTLRMASGSVVLVTGGTLIFGIPQIFRERVYDGVTTGNIQDQGSGEMKTALFKEAWTLISQRPLIGVGVDSYREHGSLGHVVHNSYLLNWVEGGLLAIIGFGGLFLWCVVLGFRCMVKNLRPQGALIIATAIALGFSSLTNTHLYSSYWFLPLTITLIVGYTKLGK